MIGSAAGLSFGDFRRGDDRPSRWLDMGVLVRCSSLTSLPPTLVGHPGPARSGSHPALVGPRSRRPRSPTRSLLSEVGHGDRGPWYLRLPGPRPLGLEPAVIALPRRHGPPRLVGPAVEQTLDRVVMERPRVLRRALSRGRRTRRDRRDPYRARHGRARGDRVPSQAVAPRSAWTSAIAVGRLTMFRSRPPVIPPDRDLGTAVETAPLGLGSLGSGLPRRKRHGDRGIRERGRGRPCRRGRVTRSRSAGSSPTASS